jgi:anti-sigma28 factor (negative regulator of flagellin synthesis)
VEKSKNALKNGSYLMSANILTKVLMENSEKLPLMDVLGYPLADISLNEMRKIHKTKTYDTIYKNFDIKDKSQQQAIVKIAETLFDSPRVSRHIQDAYFRNVGGNIVENTVTVKQYLSQAGKVMKNFQYGASIIA